MSRTRHHRGQRVRSRPATTAATRSLWLVWYPTTESPTVHTRPNGPPQYTERVLDEATRLARRAGATVECCDEDAFRIHAAPGPTLRALRHTLDQILGPRTR